MDNLNRAHSTNHRKSSRRATDYQLMHTHEVKWGRNKHNMIGRGDSVDKKENIPINKNLTKYPFSND